MRVVVTATVLAFLSSWALAEWPGTTYRTVSGRVQGFDGDRFAVHSFLISLNDVTIVSPDGTTVASRDALRDGQMVTVTMRCRPNTLPGCKPQTIRLH